MLVGPPYGPTSYLTCLTWVTTSLSAPPRRWQSSRSSPRSPAPTSLSQRQQHKLPRPPQRSRRLQAVRASRAPSPAACHQRRVCSCTMRARQLATPVEIWNCFGSPAQTFSWLADGSIRAYASTTPMCLTSMGTGQDGDRIQIQACAGSVQQKWTATAAGEIRGLNGKCLDVVDASPTNGNRLLLWNCSRRPEPKVGQCGGSRGRTGTASSAGRSVDGQRVVERLDPDGAADRTGDRHAARRVRQRLDRAYHRMELFELRGGERLLIWARDRGGGRCGDDRGDERGQDRFRRS